jgi:hypothetical protein
MATAARWSACARRRKPAPTASPNRGTSPNASMCTAANTAAVASTAGHTRIRRSSAPWSQPRKKNSS